MPWGFFVSQTATPSFVRCPFDRSVVSGLIDVSGNERRCIDGVREIRIPRCDIVEVKFSLDLIELNCKLSAW